MKSKEAYEKINHTLCLNSMNLNFAIDDVEHLDCVNPEEMIECLEKIEHDLEVLEHLKVLFNGFKVLEKNGVKYKDIYKDMYLSCKKVMMI